MKYIILVISCLLIQSVFAQTKLPVIKATSKSVSINDGGYLDRNAWTLSLGIKPDIFTADRTRATKWVTFYTDIDSIRVKVKPGTKFNFVVLLNGKDSCYTQIASALPAINLQQNNIVKNDTIPFTLTSSSAIAVKAVINSTDTLTLHFDISSFNFHLTRDAILKKTKLLSNQPDALAGKTVPNYNKLNKVFKLQMANVVWDNPPVSTTNLTSDGMDGRLGWNVFEDRIVEVNYDSNMLIIRNKLPGDLKGYIKSKLEFIRSYPCVSGSFEINGKKYTGNFMMDTGSNLALILDSAWANKQNFANNLNVIKSSFLSDPRGIKYETKTVLTPAFKLNGFKLTNIPALVLGTKNPTGFEINLLGNDLLKRFNMILDLEDDYLYLKPNKLQSLKFKES